MKSRKTKLTAGAQKFARLISEERKISERKERDARTAKSAYKVARSAFKLAKKAAKAARKKVKALKRELRRLLAKRTSVPVRSKKTTALPQRKASKRIRKISRPRKNEQNRPVPKNPVRQEQDTIEVQELLPPPASTKAETEAPAGLS